MSDHAPKPFTDSQRDLFRTVAKLNRAKPDDFVEADQWIDTKPKPEREELAEYRQRCKAEGRERRDFHPTRYLDLSGEQIQAYTRLARLEPKYNLLDAVAVMDEWVNCGHYEQSAFFEFTTSATWLKKWRRERGRTIRHALRDFRERIEVEDKHGPLRPSELVDMAASKFIHAIEPIVFDGMNSQLKAQWARRLLRLVWIMTDVDDLAPTELGWLREWKWGEFALEFLVGVDGVHLPIPRLWLRTTTLDRELEEWEKLTRDALRALEEALPGSTAIPQQPSPNNPANPLPAVAAKPRRKWTQEEVDAGIDQIRKAEPRYPAWMKMHVEGSTAHHADAEAVLSLNSIYESKKFPKGRISASPVWAHIFTEIGIGSPPRTAKKGEQVGEAMGLNKSASEGADPVVTEAAINEAKDKLLKSKLPDDCIDKFVLLLDGNKIESESVHELVRAADAVFSSSLSGERKQEMVRALGRGDKSIDLVMAELSQAADENEQNRRYAKIRSIPKP